MIYNKYNRGSEWRKWDLHIHAPFNKLNDGYKVEDSVDVLDKFCDELEKSDVMVFGITDYFSFSAFERFIKRFNEKYPNSEKRFFFNLELRLNEIVNRELEEVNVHLIFNPISIDRVSKFLSNLSVVKTGEDETPIMCSELKEGKDFESATVTRKSITDAFEKTYGKKAIRQDHFLVITAANNDGLRPERGKKRKEDICDEIDKFSDGFFGGVQNVEYYLNEDRFEGEKLKAIKKPVVSGSDAHSFEDIKNFLGKRFIKEESLSDSDKINEIIVKDVTWIKADPTFEGLKQIIYEPELGERVFIGPTRPDKKDKYKVIDKIVFDSECKFPKAIKFNSNLCSIIGSRSSGKSALLAYVAHAVDKKLTEERMPGGPGAGISWGSVDFSYKVKWSNGLDNDNSPGQIVYIPQNYLFRISSQPDEIKDKIEPVFFKLLPDFKNRYINALESIKNHNINIEHAVDAWFLNADKIYKLIDQIKSLGDKEAIKKEIERIKNKIENIKKKFSLTEDDVKDYQNVSSAIKSKEEKIRSISSELIQISSQLENQSNDNNIFFKKVTLELEPSLDNLPESLKNKILEEIAPHKSNFLKEVNLIVKKYKEELEGYLVKLKEDIDQERVKNKSLIEKNAKNKELQELVENLNNQNILIEKIESLENIKTKSVATLKENEKTIKEEIKKRKSVLDRLLSYLNSLDQDDFDIIFGLEYGIDNVFQETLIKKINKLESSDFFDRGSGKLKLNEIRNNPINFIKKIYSGEQKINVGYDKKNVVKDMLTLTEKILFTAEMEGDKIGGFQKSTMTAGKQALFALKLILGESDDKWPLLIDQPEDDLDSRSIYDHIVPFLKKKKKERQIIMVSHNANLVIGSDSEQIIVSNRNGDDRPNEDGKEFNYFSGSIENTKKKDKEKEKIDILKSQGIREHACDVLDGGKIAFEHRRNKYNLKK